MTWAVEDLTSRNALRPTTMSFRAVRACSRTRQRRRRSRRCSRPGASTHRSCTTSTDWRRASREADNVRFDAIDLPELTRWAIAGRYPDDLEVATHADAERAVDLARHVLDAVHTALDL